MLSCRDPATSRISPPISPGELYTPQGLKGYHHTNLKDNRQENPATATCTNKTPAMSPQVLLNPTEEAEVPTMFLDANGRLRGMKRRRRDESDSEDRPVRDVRRLCFPAQASDTTGYPPVHDHAVSSEPSKPSTTSVTLYQRHRRRRYTKTVADWGKRGNLKRRIFKEWIPYPADESSASEEEDEDVASITNNVADGAPVSIQDVTTISTSSLTPYAIINEHDNLDRLEFSIGIERGGIVQYTNSPLLTVELREDMVELLRQNQWALVPSSDTLRLMQELFIHNHKCAPRHRLKFTKIIPIQDEYEYKLFYLQSEASPALYIQGQHYTYPFKYLPVVRCSLHPCFTIPSALRFFNEAFMLSNTGAMNEAEVLCSHVGRALGTAVFASWVKTVRTKTLGRPVPFARYDPVDSSDPPVYPKLLASVIAANANGSVVGVGTKTTHKAGLPLKQKLSGSTATSEEESSRPLKRP